MNTSATATPGKTARRLRVLVAEDSAINQQVALKQLEKLGHHAELATNGHQVIDALKRAAFDVILMDCNMPELNGYDATWLIRNQEKEQAGTGGTGPHVYIIAMTANDDGESRRRCREAGMDGYVSKPVRLPELQAALERASRREANGETIDPVAIAALRQLRETGKPDPLAEFIDLFVSDTPAQLAVIEQAIARRESDSMSRAVGAATRLKGGAGNLGAHRFAELCARIQAEAESGTLADIAPLLAAARDEFARARAALEKIKAEPDPA